MLHLVRDDERAPRTTGTTRTTRPPATPCETERRICSDAAPGGLTLYTFEDQKGNVIGYAQIAVGPADGIVPRQVVELYDLCALDAAARSLRMG